MKKMLVGMLLFVCLTSSFSALAAEVPASRVSVDLLRDWASEKWGTKIDKDGDLVLTIEGNKVFVSVIPKVKLIRIYTIFSAYEKRSKAEMILLANKFNDGKRFLRVCITDSGASVCDYYLIYNGGLNSTNFFEAVDWFRVMEQDWCDFAIKGGSEE